MKKIRTRQLILKKYSCYGLKKIHARNLITKKKFLRLENSPPPHNFSNSPSLILSFLRRGAGDGQVGCEGGWGVTLFLGE